VCRISPNEPALAAGAFGLSKSAAPVYESEAKGFFRPEFFNRIDTVVTFELSQTEQGGTHLRIVHEGFAMMASAANDNGETRMMRAA